MEVLHQVTHLLHRSPHLQGHQHHLIPPPWETIPLLLDVEYLPLLDLSQGILPQFLLQIFLNGKPDLKRFQTYKKVSHGSLQPYCEHG